MKISKKTDYALRALFHLVEHRESGPIPIARLARQNAVPKKFLEHIMLDLKSQGWVRSVPGKKGGYKLAKDPERITMGEIVRYFDGLVAPINCVSVNQYETCSQEARCRFRHLFLQIRDSTARMMDMA
ncbi:MAG: Rrf2 family transcriptional regulator, partial [Anaerolineales bacterium]